MYDREFDEELIRLARRGDRGAFSALFERHARAVYLYAWSMLREDRDAEDVTQEVFVVAWRRLAGIRILETSTLPWLLVTKRNLSRNALRARRAPLSLDESLLPGIAPGRSGWRSSAGCARPSSGSVAWISGSSICA